MNRVDRAKQFQAFDALKGLQEELRAREERRTRVAKKEQIDVYEAVDMFLPGLFAYRSILDGGIPKEIPNLRDKAVRDLWRNDTACTDEKVAGDMLLPTFSKGTPDIDDSVYQRVYEAWRKDVESKNGYNAAALKQGEEN